jgi:hypothetical protein
MIKREETLKQLAEDILEWSKAYPDGIFTEPTPEQVDTVCKMLGIRIDNIAAMILSKCTKHWGERAENALKSVDIKKCKWKLDTDYDRTYYDVFGLYYTECNHEFDESHYHIGDFKYCPFCGKEIEEQHD